MTQSALAATSCPACGTELAPSLLSCPGCHRLVHADALTRLAGAAHEAERAGDPSAALARWREALDLLPPQSRQHAAIARRVDELSRAVSASGAAAPTADERPAWARRAGVVGTAALLVLSKAKLLLLGLTKLGTVWSMLLSLGVYTSMYGWTFALGLVLSIYVHEMGHVAALDRYGIKASAPMFIPGLGALIRLKQARLAPREDARVGLAGPVWGLGAALAAYGAFLLTGAPAWGVIARWGALLNLFNLIPVWQLDGARGTATLSREYRWCLALLAGVLWLLTQVGFVGIVALGLAWRATQKSAPAERDTPMLALYAFLLAALGAVARI